MIQRLRGNAVIAAHWLSGQRRAPFYPREKLDALRDRRIRDIVRHAARHVPYYREWFAREGIDPRSIKGAAELDRLPVLNKELVRAQPRLFVAENARRTLSFLTSGSTGAPVEIHHDHDSLLANIPHGERERDPVNRLCGGSFRPKELYVGYDTSTFKKVIAFYEQHTMLPVRPRRRTLSLTEPIERIVELANTERPDILVGYGGWVALFFRAVAARNLALRPPQLVMYMGEALPHGAREFIEEQFGIPVMSRYNAVESFKIGFFCEQRRGFHIHEDLCHVRILPPGQQGQVVISNLINRATVLLNYPIGDLGSISPVPCPCGRTFRVLSELEGRVEDILPLADGRHVHPRAVWQVFKDDREVLQYQLTQHEPRRFSLMLVTVDGPSFQRALERARPLLDRLLGADALITAEHRTELARVSGRKFRAVASTVPQTATGPATTRPPQGPGDGTASQTRAG
ncbi:MAG: phenylacetate--CoA ligase family protein [Verrucomicrobia bacterium]|nr:phenylacetate--CoA ligase family protein [Verrucomicrobiota bacterium]